MGKSWCILCYWVLELPVRLGKGIGRTHGPPLPSSLHTQNGVVLERYPTCSLRNKMLLKSHWDPRILPLRLYNLGTPSEKVGSCRTQGNPTILGTYLQDLPARPPCFKHGPGPKTFRLPLHFYFRMGGGL